MQRERICANDQEPDVSGDECAQQIDKIRVHRAVRLVIAKAPD